MAVPNTITFTMTDVKANVAGSPDDLVAAFAQAISTAFNPSYSGAKNTLLNFRDYDESRNFLEISTDSILVIKSGGAYNFGITSNTTYSISSNVPWITITFPSTGQSTGNITCIFNVSGNGSPLQRSGQITINTIVGSPSILKNVNVTQSG